MGDWDLYIDESGNFESLEDDPLIASILMPEGPRESNPAWQRKLLEDELTWIPWPIHSTDAKNPVMHVLWPHALGRRPAESIADRFEDIVAALEQQESEALARASEQVRRHRRVDREDLRSLRVVLRDRREDWSVLNRVSRRSLERLKSVAKTIGDGPLSSIVVVGEPKRGDAWPMRDGEDRYLTMLPALLQRVADAVLEETGTHVVRVHVMVRDVVDSTLAAAGARVGKKGAPELHLRHVTEAVRQALGESAPSLQRGGAKVRFVPGLLGRNHDSNLRAGFVLADFAANALFRHFPGEANLTETCRLVRRKTRQRVTYDEAPRRPHVAASGQPFKFLYAIRGDRDSRPLKGDDSLRCWAIEQANEWGSSL